MDINNNISDDELWRYAASGNIDAEEMLLQKYSRLVKICSRPYFLAGGDSEDLIQEGMMGLLSAIRRYNPDRVASFKTYAELCIRNHLYTAIKSASRFKHIPLNNYVSFESPQFDENHAFSAGSSANPEELLINRERVAEITESLSGSLSGFESQVLELYFDGLSYVEIAKKISKTPKSVDNAVQRIRKKLARYLINGDISEN